MPDSERYPSPRYHEAYMFTIGEGEDRISGVVHKLRPRPAVYWEARVDGSSLRTHAATRGEAVLMAWLDSRDARRSD